MTGTTPSEEFRVEEVRPRPGVAVLAVYGEVDLHVAGEFRDHLTALLDDDLLLVVDLTGVTFVDSMTLGVLLGALKRVRAAGGQLRLVLPPAGVRRMFELTLLDRVFDFDATRDEALAAIGS